MRSGGEPSEGNCGELYKVIVYNQMLTRMSPYIFGMFCAQKVLKGEKKPNIFLEWIAFVVMLFINQVGVE